MKKRSSNHFRHSLRNFVIGALFSCAFVAWIYQGARRKSINLGLLVAVAHNREGTVVDDIINGKGRSSSEAAYAEELEALLKQGADPNITTEAYPYGSFTSEMRHWFNRDMMYPSRWSYFLQESSYASQVDGGPPLIWSAAQFHDKTLFNALLRRGADPDTAFDFSQHKATTLLMVVAEWGDADVMKSLLRRHPHINIRDNNGATPLHHAVYQYNLAAARLLLQARANPNVGDNYGYTPLMNVAASVYNAIPENTVLDMANLLLEYHADINQHNKYHKTALTIAREQRHDRLVAFLLQHGACE